MEEIKGKIEYTNNQKNIEKYMNQTIKGRSQLRDLRIRKDNDGLPKKLVQRNVPTLNRRQKTIRTIVIIITWKKIGRKKSQKKKKKQESGTKKRRI
jgi:hypothetical protein